MQGSLRGSVGNGRTVATGAVPRADESGSRRSADTGWRVSAAATRLGAHGADPGHREDRRRRARSPPRRRPRRRPPARSDARAAASRPSPGPHALIIRSATTVTADVLAAGQDLVVVGRAGIGLDNVDTEAATTQGVMVVNAPQSNILTTAEHTMAMLLAQARNIPQAHAALIEGRWERSRGGRASSWPTRRSASSGSAASASWWPSERSAFGMKVVAHDPFVAPERARQINVELLEPRRARRARPTSSPSTW